MIDAERGRALVRQRFIERPLRNVPRRRDEAKYFGQLYMVLRQPSALPDQRREREPIPSCRDDPPVQ